MPPRPPPRRSMSKSELLIISLLQQLLSKFRGKPHAVKLQLVQLLAPDSREKCLRLLPAIKGLNLRRHRLLVIQNRKLPPTCHCSFCSASYLDLCPQNLIIKQTNTHTHTHACNTPFLTATVQTQSHPSLSTFQVWVCAAQKRLITFVCRKVLPFRDHKPTCLCCRSRSFPLVV